jgi:hypothetical protein
MTGINEFLLTISNNFGKFKNLKRNKQWREVNGFSFVFDIAVVVL